jgi:hypothetical protein
MLNNLLNNPSFFQSKNLESSIGKKEYHTCHCKHTQKTERLSDERPNKRSACPINPYQDIEKARLA